MSETASPGLFALIKEDYRSHGCDWHRPGFKAMAVYRFGVWRMKIRPFLIRGGLSVLYRMMFRRCAHVYGIEVPFTAKVGRRVIFEHQHGIVVHGGSVIGDDCIIRHGVTLGIRDEGRLTEAPTLGARVSVGAGAKILGAVRIGDDVKIGANAVVLRDIPSSCVAVGIPARIIFPERHSALEIGREVSS